uniref:Zinc finger SWIM domain-containing protein 7 n=1 Tax=Culex pipiens TaxID=7175 RepID=A0A8D8PI62_CULPI
MSSDFFVFYDAIDSLLERIQHSAGSSNSGTKELPKEHLLELESLFGRALLNRTLELVYGKKPIKLYRTPDCVGQLYEVPGSEFAVVYKIFPGINYCTCKSYRFWVLQQRHQALCKHLLATRLAPLVDRVITEEITQQAYLEVKAALIRERLKPSEGRVDAGEGTSRQKP